MEQLQDTIERAWEERVNLAPGSAPAKIGEAVDRVLDELDQGRLRVAQKVNGSWVTHQWIKKAVLLSFRLEGNRPIRAGALQFYDKVRTKFERYDQEQFERGGFRVVPPAVARRGAYIAKNVVLMPSFVNVGAYVDEGTMVDTWATVGSCAQIGRNVHLSGGAGIGGVLEPPSAVPVVVEDDAFIGSRSMVVEGARVRTGAKLGAGTILTSTTHVIDVSTGQELPRGEAPAWSVCVSGTRVRSFPGGDFGMPCVLVLRRLAEGSGHDRLALNEILRDHGVSG
jgi:2,3,4,5-tetrahydropyridine-2-carboxylate N-succinyltransferase